jgi:hypothetical protein
MRQIYDEIVDLIVIGTIATPNAVALNIVEAEALGTRNERMQQAFSLADVLSSLQIV